MKKAHKNTYRHKLVAFRASHRLLISAICGGSVSLLVGSFVSWEYAPLAFWDTAAVVVMGTLWFSLSILSPEETAAHAKREDPGRASASFILTIASLMSLGAVVVLLAQTSHSSGVHETANVGISILSIVISWAVVHIVYALRYADLYFKEGGGIDFHSKNPPSYIDFIYLAFTIGMTYQVSDTSLGSSEFRKLSLHHALLSYLFGTAIIASTINFIAGLGK